MTFYLLVFPNLPLLPNAQGDQCLTVRVGEGAAKGKSWGRGRGGKQREKGPPDPDLLFLL